MKRFIKKLLICICFFSVIAIISNHLPFILINGNSMTPTYKDGQFVLINYDSTNLDRDDIVIAKQKINLPFEEKIIKRICGVYGDQIYMDSNGTYFVYDGNKIYYYDGSLANKGNNVILADSKYLYTIGKNEYFVMGDNRNASIDSRYFGTINKTKIIAKVK